MTEYRIIPLSSDGEGRRTVDLDGVIVILVTRYNYTTSCWSMDILDVDGIVLVAGVMLVPDVDLLKPHTAIKAQIGSLSIVENVAGDYESPDKLGEDVKLIWTP